MLPITGGHQVACTRPTKATSHKVALSLRLDQSVLEGFKAEGPGWQTRMNAVLAASLKPEKKSA